MKQNQNKWKRKQKKLQLVNKFNKMFFKFIRKNENENKKLQLTTNSHSKTLPKRVNKMEKS